MSIFRIYFRFSSGSHFLFCQSFFQYRFQGNDIQILIWIDFLSRVEFLVFLHCKYSYPIFINRFAYDRNGSISSSASWTSCK